VKKFIVNHGEKVLCAVIVAVCVYTIVDAVRIPENEIVTKINDAKGKIQEALEKNPVGSDFRYHVSRREAFAGNLAEHLKRAEDIPQEPAPPFAFYPQPDKPEIVAKSAPPPRPTEPAVLTALTSFAARPEHGKVVLASRAPKAPAGLKHFVPVRIEIFRGATADKVEEKVGTVELASEVEGEALEPKAGPKTEEPSRLEAEGTTARSAKAAEGKAETKKTPRGKSSKTAKAAEPTIDYEDYEVAPKTTYWYRARLVARLEKLGPENTAVVDGKPVEIIVPADLVKVPGNTEGVTLYASVWTPVASATLPPDILVRFAGLIGELQTNPDPRFAPSGYGGNFGIRIWRAKKRAWAEATLPVDVGKPIAGKATFRVGNDSEEIKYNTDLTLVDIKRATIIDVKTRNEPVMKEVKNEQGEIERVPLLDEDGKPVYKEVLIENRSPTEVALLKRGETGQIERFPKAGGTEWETKDARVFLEGEQEPPLAAPEKKAEAPVKKAEEPAAPKKAEGVRAPAHVKKAEEPAKK